jgi:hypothetical protein
MRRMQRLLLDERITADGRHVRTWATLDAGALHVADDDDPGRERVLPIAALDRVMVRYGRALDDTIALGDALDLGDGRALHRLRYHAPVDTEGRDYLVWVRPGEPALAVLAAHATAAMRYLVLRLDAERTPSEI